MEYLQAFVEVYDELLKNGMIPLTIQTSIANECARYIYRQVCLCYNTFSAAIHPRGVEDQDWQGPLLYPDKAVTQLQTMNTQLDNYIKQLNVPPQRGHSRKRASSKPKVEPVKPNAPAGAGGDAGVATRALSSLAQLGLLFSQQVSFHAFLHA